MSAHADSLPDAEATLAALAERMRGAVAFDAAFVGIYSGGAWLAERLAGAGAGRSSGRVHRRIVLPRRLLDARDSRAAAGAPSLPFDVDGATIVLVDDVLYTGRSVRAARQRALRLRPSRAHRARRADRPRRPRAADRADLLRRAPRGRARPVDRAVARRRPPCARRRKAGELIAMRNPQLNANGELTHLLTLEGLPRRRDPQHPRHRRSVRVDRRARGEEGAAAARQGGVQPVLRELDAHAHDLRDRRQAPVRRRHQPQHRRVVDEQGRNAARHRSTTWSRWTPTSSSCAIRSRARRTSSRAPERARPQPRPRRQRRRRPPRASDAGPARPVHDPPLQEGLPQSHGGDRRRRAALARRALADPRPDHAGHAGSARDRPEDAAAGARRGDGRAGVPRHARGPARLRRRRDAAPAERADERRAAAVGRRILQALRADAGQARAREARRDRHASRAR